MEAIVKPYLVQEEIPDVVSEADVLYILKTKNINSDYLNLMKHSTAFGDDDISDWLNISKRTLQTYKKPNSEFKESIKEHLVHLMSVFKHGSSVFGDTQTFEQWLNTPNFYFDNEAPKTYLNKISGIRFIHNRLTAMEYGDNV